MKKSVFLLGVLTFLAGTAGAQARLNDPAAAGFTTSSAPAVATDAAAPQEFALAADPSTAASSNAAATEADSVPAQGPSPRFGGGGVQSVFPQYNWQAYAGYTFTHFYEAPGFSPNLNGFNLAIEYFPHTGALGADGELVAVFGSQAHHTAELWAGMGGGRYRFAAPRGMEVWVHGLVGGAKLVPQTPFGGQNGLAYDVGAGVDIGAWNHRFAFRFAGDMLATRFFGTGQYSPRASAGIVFKY